MNTHSLFSLFTAVRSACTTPVWSQGSKLFQMGVVEGVSRNSEEIVFRLHLPGVLTTPTVVLYPEDQDWECDCDSPSDACAHVAAAAIALKQAEESGEDLPKSRAGATCLCYRFNRHPTGLTLQRLLVLGEDREVPLDGPLTTDTGARPTLHGYRPSSEDLAVDRVAGRLLGRRGPLNPGVLRQVLRHLKGTDAVALDGAATPVADDPIYPEAFLEDGESKAIVLTISPNSDLTEVLAPGVGLAGGAIVELGEHELAGARWEKLPVRAEYTPETFAELAATVLPELQKRISVEICTGRLPDTVRFMQPRLTLATKQSDGAVSVFPELVYGDPPHVKIINDKMVYIQGGVPVRDRQKERRLTDQLRDQLNLVINRKVVVKGRDALFFLERIQAFSEATLDPSQHPLADMAPLDPRVEVEDDIFKIVFVLTDEPLAASAQPGARRTADPTNVLSAWREGLSMAPLDGGGWAPIPKAWLAEHGHLVQDLLQARLAGDRVSPAAIPALARLCDALSLPPQPCFDRLRPLIDGFEAIPEAPLPPDLTATLRAYQKAGVSWLSFLKRSGMGGILADDMGLGKTVQALAVISGRTLVVAPTSVITNWASEAARFRPGCRVCLFHGPKRALDPEADILITTYALLRNDLTKLRDLSFDMIVLDEAQIIKNPASQAAKAAFQLRGDFRLALSGTPVENRLDELWSLFNFCNRGLLGSRADFQKQFADPVSAGDMDATRRLRERIAPFVLRRLKREVAPELPKRSEQTLYCELDERERAVYDAVRAATSKSVVAELSKGKSVLAALEALLRLRQCACHLDLVPGQSAETSSKLNLLRDQLTISIDEGHKALVFSQWTSLLDRVEPVLDALGVDYLRLDGSTRDRGGVVRRFQHPEGPPVMLISLKAGGTGLNLTEADHVFLLDPWWNPAVEDQAADRTHRIGQTKPVMVYRLVARESVEERIMALKEQKRALANAALGGADKALSLTKEDLLALLA